MNQRIEPRYSANLAVRLHWNRRVYVGVTEDVSHRGMRVRTNALPDLRQLIRVEVELPGAAGTLQVHAMVAHASVDSFNPQAAVGLQLYGVSDDARERWGSYVNDVAAVPRPATRAGRSAVVEISADSKLQAAKIRLASTIGGTLFVDSSMKLDPGDVLHLVTKHPITGRTIALQSKVIRAIESDEAEGLLVEVSRQRAPATEAAQAAPASAKSDVPAAVIRPAVTRASHSRVRRGRHRSDSRHLAGNSFLRLRA